MHAIYEALRKTSGSTDGKALIAAMKGMTWESPRGPMSIDSNSGEVVHNIYIRKVEKIDGELFEHRIRNFQQRQGSSRRGKMKNLEVIVAGGGIGGLSLALSLHQVGIEVRVYEAVLDPSPLGVGINLQPTAVRELTELGLGGALGETGIATHRLSLCNKFGQLIHGERRGLDAGYRWPQYSIHRGELQLLLLRAVRDRIGDENVRTGLKLAGFEQDGRVRARFIDRQFGCGAG